MTPRFPHDCLQCIYLGTIHYPAPHYRSDKQHTLYTQDQWADLYFCKQCDGGSLLARFSAEGSDYASSPYTYIVEHLTQTVGYAKERVNGELNLVEPHQTMSTSEPAMIAALVFARAKGLIASKENDNV